MGVWKNVRMRCAFRYLFCLLVLILTFVSIHLALISDKTAYFFKQNFLPKTQHININNEKAYGTRNLSKALGLNIKTFLASGDAHRMPVTISWQEYKNNPSALTGNPLIDNYGKNDPAKMGENGSGIILVGAEKDKATRLISKFNVNVYASDRIPLNRMVPDARFSGYVVFTNSDILF